MKMIRFSSLMMLALFAALFTFNSCEKEAVQPQTNEDAAGIEEFAFNKTITLTDEAGTASVDYMVAANDQATLNSFSAENFDLIAIPEGRSSKEVIDAFYQDLPDMDEGFEDADEETATGKSSAGMMIVSQRLSPGIASVAITVKPTDDDLRASWGYYNHYSSAGVDNHFSIRRHSWNRRVFYGLKYKTTQFAAWSDIKNEWQKLKNNQEYGDDRTPSYQFKFRVKTKKTHAYTVEFDAQ